MSAEKQHGCRSLVPHKLVNTVELEEQIKIINSMDFYDGIGRFAPSSDKALSQDEQELFTAGFLQGVRLMHEQIIENLSSHQVRYEIFDSYANLVSFVNGNENNERSFDTVECCDLVVDAQFNKYTVAIGMNNTMLFQREKNKAFYHPVDGDSLNYPIVYIKNI